MSLSVDRRAARIEGPIVRSPDKTSHNPMLRIGNTIL